MIVKSAHIVNSNVSDFSKGVKEVIEDFQNTGLKVEVQYQPINIKDEYEYIVYTAFIIGRKEK